MIPNKKASDGCARWHTSSDNNNDKINTKIYNNNNNNCAIYTRVYLCETRKKDIKKNDLVECWRRLCQLILTSTHYIAASALLSTSMRKKKNWLKSVIRCTYNRIIIILLNIFIFIWVYPQIWMVLVSYMQYAQCTLKNTHIRTQQHRVANEARKPVVSKFSVKTKKNKNEKNFYKNIYTEHVSFF